MTNENQVCCGPIVRLSGNEYRCSTKGCEKDVTDDFRSAGLDGEVIRWIVERPFVLDAKDRARWPAIVEAWSKSDNPTLARHRYNEPKLP